MATIPTPCKSASCQQLLSSNDVIIHGSLRQRHPFNRIVENALPTVVNIKWSRRYAVLQNACLYLFNDEMSAHPLRSSTSLFGYTTCECCSQEVSAHIPWPFKVSSELETRPRIYYFSAASQNESLKWVEKIQQQMNLANSSLTYIAPKGATFGLFPSDAPSAEALPLPRVTRDRSSSDPVTLSTLAHSHSKRSLPPPPIIGSPPSGSVQFTSPAESSGDRQSDEDEEYDDDYDELIDVSKPGKAAMLIEGLRKLMLVGNRCDSPDVAGKLSHSLSSPSTFHIDIDAYGTGVSQEDTVTSPSYETISTTSTLKPKPMTAVKPCVSIKKTTPLPPPPTVQPFVEKQSPPIPVPRKRTFSDSHACVEPGLVGAYWSKSANEGEELMKSLTTEGTFMIRESKERGQQTLMVRCEASVSKYRIFADEEGKFYLDASNPRFSTRSALLSHYTKNYLPRGSVMLSKPYSTVMLSSANAAVGSTYMD